jgi:hypothetical protein
LNFEGTSTLESNLDFKRLPWREYRRQIPNGFFFVDISLYWVSESEECNTKKEIKKGNRREKKKREFSAETRDANG